MEDQICLLPVSFNSRHEVEDAFWSFSTLVQKRNKPQTALAVNSLYIPYPLQILSASTPGCCDLQRNCIISGRARTSDQNGSHSEKDTQDSEARPERYARQKEREQSAGLPFCTGTNASHIAERELKDTGSRGKKEDGAAQLREPLLGSV